MDAIEDPTDTRIEFGDIVRDKTSGNLGVVYGIAEHLTGCDRVALMPVDSPTFTDQESWFYPTELSVTDKDGQFTRGEEDEVVETPSEDDPVTDVEYELGNVLEDDLTGFEGYATIITYEMFNCPRICLTPTIGDADDAKWFDVPRLSFVREGVTDEYEDLHETDEETTTGAADESGFRTDPSLR